MELLLGGGRLDRVITEVEAVVAAYFTDDGTRYLDYAPMTPADRLVPEGTARPPGVSRASPRDGTGM